MNCKAQVTVQTEEPQPWFDEEGNMVLYYEEVSPGQYSKFCIPARQVKIIYDNLMQGKPYEVASPVYEITRQQAAFILTNYRRPTR